LNQQWNIYLARFNLLKAVHIVEYNLVYLTD
jgi:hypothetical protein